MANGYLRIKKADIYENNGVTYWKNGANIIGNVVKCVDSDEAEHYYIESLKTRKAILLDDDVKIGGGDFGFESTNGNFILITTDEVNFSDIGGGDGVSITFTFGNKYYTVTLPEDNGDLKIYDPDGEGGETGADPLPDVTDASAGDALVLDENKIPVWSSVGGKKYLHNIMVKYSTSSDFSATFLIINDSPNKYDTKNALKSYLTSVSYSTTASGVAKIGSKPQIITRYNTSDNTGMSFNATEVDFSAGTLTASALVAQWATISNVYDTVIEI